MTVLRRAFLATGSDPPTGGARDAVAPSAAPRPLMAGRALSGAEPPARGHFLRDLFGAAGQRLHGQGGDLRRRHSRWEGSEGGGKLRIHQMREK